MVSRPGWVPPADEADDWYEGERPDSLVPWEMATPPPPDPRMARAYAAELTDSSGDGPHVAFCVWTTRFEDGRGDIYVAVGLGRQLRRLGYRVSYVARESWDLISPSVDVVVAMIPRFDPRLAPRGSAVVAWVRNETERWAEHPALAAFGGVLASSPLSLERMRSAFDGPTALLPLAADLEFFAEDRELPPSRGGVVCTVNSWGRERDVHRGLRIGKVRFPLVLHGAEIGLHPDLRPYAAGMVDYFALPALYRRSQIVLDDCNHTTLPYGNVNSRLFEALAAGCLPVTNGTLGLAELGLAEVPRVPDMADLATEVRELLADPDELSARAARLRDVVRAGHGFAHRARALGEFIEQLEAAPPPRARIAFFPDYRETNPYQAMLYSEAVGQQVATYPIRHVIHAPESVTPIGSLDRWALHVHWTAPILQPSADEEDAERRLKLFAHMLDDIATRGGKLIWTVHNELPHDGNYLDQERRLGAMLAERADLIHVMCPGTDAFVAGSFRLPPEKLLVVPHGSYIGMYGDAASRESARQRLGLPADATVLTCLGGIRPYRGIDRLLDAFERVSAADRSLHLVVAGKPGRFHGIEELERRCVAMRRVHPFFEHVADDHVQHHLAAADVVVLPHRKVLNSGGLQLALSFARPVVAPRVGCLDEALEPEFSIGFSPTDAGALERALGQVRTLCTPEARRAAFAAASRYGYRDMSRDFLAGVDKLWHS